MTRRENSNNNPSAAEGSSSLLAIYAELGKSRIVKMVLVTFAVGFAIGSSESGRGGWLELLFGIVGTALSAAGAGALNCYFERDLDGLMRRTQKRPLPTGKISPQAALVFGFLTAALGIGLLLIGTNPLTAILSAASLVLYVFVYTPLKRITWLSTTIGAVPGALPMLGGWTAATGSIDALGIALFLILFVWQHPHFYALAWLYREDYRRAGFAMLPVIDESGARTFRHILVYSLVLLPVSIIPVVLGASGSFYYYGALFLGATVLALSVFSALTRAPSDCRRLFRATLLYFPLLLLVVLADVGIRSLLSA